MTPGYVNYLKSEIERLKKQPIGKRAKVREAVRLGLRRFGIRDNRVTEEVLRALSEADLMESEQ